MINDARDWLYKEFVLRKLNSRFGAILLGVITIVISFAVVNLSFVIGPVLVALLAGLILVFICLNYPLLGFYIIISISCFAFFLSGCWVSLFLLVPGLNCWFLLSSSVSSYNEKFTVRQSHSLKVQPPLPSLCFFFSSSWRLSIPICTHSQDGPFMYAGTSFFH